MFKERSFNVIVIGGGPAGVTAALRARELGATVALVERGTMGGTCTNDGCVPTRVLARAARLMRNTAQFEAYGLSAARPTLDFDRLLNRTQQIIYTIHEKKQLAGHLRTSGVEVFIEVGAARFVDPHTIVTESGERLRGERFILCVGGYARRLDFPGAEYALTHSDVWRLKEQPQAVAIVGGAATGCQLASVFRDFDSEVMLLDAAPRLLAGEDEDVSAGIKAAFVEQGIGVQTGIGFDSRIEKLSDGLRYHYTVNEKAHSVDVDAVILAVGWLGNVEGLGLEAAGVHHERSYIEVDEYLRSSAGHIFAAGDVTGRMMLVQSGQYEARIAAENALLPTPKRYQHQIVPHGSFTDPEYASVGLTSAEAQLNNPVATATVPYSDLDRADIDGQTTGFCKLIIDEEDHRLLGAHVVGEQALEIVHVVAAGMAANMTVETLANLEIAYPTNTAIVGLAARQLVRQLNLTPVSPQWRALKGNGAAEWELPG